MTYNNRRNDPRYSWPEAPKPGPFYRKEAAMDELSCECQFEAEPSLGAPIGHAELQCPSNYDIQLYRCADGVERWLCGNCNGIRDELLSRSTQEVKS